MSLTLALQTGDLFDKKDVDQLVAMVDSLKWIVAFCNEHPDWFGEPAEHSGAENEWLFNANKLLEEIE
jgi:hypothetical protein